MKHNLWNLFVKYYVQDCCNMHRGDEKCIQMGNLKGRGSEGDVGINQKTVTKWFLENHGEEVRNG